LISFGAAYLLKSGIFRVNGDSYSLNTDKLSKEQLEHVELFKQLASYMSEYMKNLPERRKRSTKTTTT